jgi:hypothetical protein
LFTRLVFAYTAFPNPWKKKSAPKTQKHSGEPRSAFEPKNTEQGMLNFEGVFLLYSAVPYSIFIIP